MILAGESRLSSSFRSIFGQDQACALLLSAFLEKRVPHAYLFAGPDGVGKRTAALQWAKVLNCTAPLSSVEACETCVSCRKVHSLSHPDVLHVDFRFQAVFLKEPVEKQKGLKIDTIREMERVLRLKPMEGAAKVALVEPADRLLDAAANALLKILEEPPPATHIVLLAVDANRLLGTLRSRCQWVRFKSLPAAAIAAHLRERAGAPAERAEDAALRSEGSLGRALALLDEEEGVSFDWEKAPLSELMSWCEQFHNPRLGREAAETFLRRLLARGRQSLAGGGSRDEVGRVLGALHQLKSNVSPQLILETLLLRLRYQRK